MALRGVSIRALSTWLHGPTSTLPIRRFSSASAATVAEVPQLSRTYIRPPRCFMRGAQSFKSPPRSPITRTVSRRYYSRGRDPRDYDNPPWANAKPLVTTQQISRVVRGPSFRNTIIIGVAGGLVFFWWNLEEVPVSGRRRFNCMSQKSMDALGEQSFRMVMNQMQGRILPDWDMRVRLVKRVMARLAPVSGLPDTNWEVYVIDDPGTQNAFVIPGGKVFVFSGIIPVCGGEDGLAAVLGHEIAHTLAQHQAERQSQTFMIMPIIWGMYALDPTGILGHILMRTLLNIGFERPASRKQESEADFIGLLMMAQACYNPSVAVGFWTRMHNLNVNGPPEWLSTHPSNESRIENIKEWLPLAEAQREKSDCATTANFSRQFKEAMTRPFYI